MCWVIPPASPAATSVVRIASSSEVLPWSTWPITVTTGGRRTRSASSSVKVGLVVELLTGVDDLDLLVELAGQDLDGLVGQGLGQRRHLALLHQLLDHLGAADAEGLGDLAHGRAGVDLERLLRLGARALQLGRLVEGGTAAATAAARRPLRRALRHVVAAGGLRIDHDAAALLAGVPGLGGRGGALDGCGRLLRRAGAPAGPRLAGGDGLLLRQGAGCGQRLQRGRLVDARGRGLDLDAGGLQGVDDP